MVRDPTPERKQFGAPRSRPYRCLWGQSPDALVRASTVRPDDEDRQPVPVPEPTVATEERNRLRADAPDEE
jgi:hypothetical protein